MTDQNLATLFDQGLGYTEFLDRYANESQRSRWDKVHAAVNLTDSQRELLGSFVRTMKVFVSTGAWCGDCINQCPIFDHFTRVNDRIEVRFFDRDDHPDFADTIRTCGGRRVPSLLFVSEDNVVCGRYGDRTIATYRHLIATQLGPSCPTGFGDVNQTLLQEVTEDWLREFERIQWMLRLSPRLREQYGD
ncbi:thioredoxin family protein [Rhodopirellula sp. MGV]|uniref:thioredoxin family protein n=1 Tax=Rhodopirellula sp. MGV TaxID=2023130 RepID=UPI000B96F263|nr:thioredoxin family protein [Rhodopirellula sp. MGV]OYP38402.1 thiol reductase thioredoxin [Rhodopirellula sp. MGV]PNY34178.1 thiol reductase thioredoxin [Rhodopirellula baltica]